MIFITTAKMAVNANENINEANSGLTEVASGSSNT